VIPTSDGSQAKRDSTVFLANYIDSIDSLQKGRIPSGFDQLTKGEVPDSVNDKVARGVIKV
jgi:hypothetical protein